MPYEDKLIVCADCGRDFVHSAEDQARYAERGFTNDPKRCRECREKRKARQSEGGARGRREGARGPGRGERRPQGGNRRFSGGQGPRREDRPSYEVVCASCGAMTTVPFKPTPDRPVYCRDCYRARR